MDGYYDVAPRMSLEHPLAITGYIPSETRRIGYRLSALTGLGVTDLDRKVEHVAGQSIPRLLLEEGEDAYRRLEGEALRRLLNERPFGILTLGDGALLDTSSRQRVLQSTRLVILDLDLPNLYWRLSPGGDASEEPWHPLIPHPLERFEQLQPFHGPRAVSFAEARHRIPLRGLAQAVDQLLKLLPVDIESQQPAPGSP